MSTISLISPQFLRSDKIFVTIIKVNDPANYIIKEYESSSEGMKFLEFERDMQNYYNTMEPSFFELPHSGKIVAVLFERKYFRAKVQKVIQAASKYILIVYLLDYGKECNVPHNCVYQLHSEFLKHPYQTAYFKLADIRPISLVLNPSDIMVKFGSVKTWDSSCFNYVDKLLKDLNFAYVTVKSVENDCLLGSLYITLCNGDLKCLNTDLVDNKFAEFSSTSIEKDTKILSPVKKDFSNISLKSHSETSSDCSLKNDSSSRKMASCISSDVNEFNKIKKEIKTETVTKNVPSSSNKFQQILKLCQKETSKPPINAKCSNDNVLTDLSNQFEVSMAKISSNITKEEKEISNELKFVSSEDNDRFEFNAPISEQKIVNDIKDISSNVLSSTTTSPQKKSMTVDRLKIFLNQSLVSSNSNTECVIEGTAQTKECDSSNNYIDTKNSDVFEELFKESISENDPDDILQIALNPDKKNNNSSDNESNRYGGLFY